MLILRCMSVLLGLFLRLLVIAALPWAIPYVLDDMTLVSFGRFFLSPALNSWYQAIVAVIVCSTMLRSYFSDPPPPPDRPQENGLTELPSEILELIFLQLSKQDLLLVSASCKSNNCSARRLLFRHVKITSFRRLFQFAALVTDSLSTIPSAIDTLVIHFTPPRTASVHDLCTKISIVLRHFRVISIGISINYPSLASRSMDLAAARLQMLRKFVLSGQRLSFDVLRQVIPFLNSLECLVVDASWGSNPSHPRPWHAAADEVRPPYTGVPPGIKEICLSASSLTLLNWLASPVVKLPDLHILRIKLDEDNANGREFAHIHPFIAKVAASLAHLYVWFEGCCHCHGPAYQRKFLTPLRPSSLFDALCSVLGQALKAAPGLSGLELFFLYLTRSDLDDSGDRAAVETITSHTVPPSVRCLAGRQVSGEGAFWADPGPMLCGQDAVHRSLAELSRSG